MCARILLRGFAFAVFIAGAPLAAQAQIGLSHAKKGGAYLSIDGGYQNSDGATSTAPVAGGTNPYGSDVSVQERAFASPDSAEASSSVRQGNNSGNSSASAAPGATSAATATQQTNGARFVTTGSNSQATASPTGTDTTSTVDLDAADNGVGSAGASIISTSSVGNASSTSQVDVNIAGAGISAAAATATAVNDPPPRSASSGGAAVGGPTVSGSGAASSAATSDFNAAGGVGVGAGAGAGGASGTANANTGAGALNANSAAGVPAGTFATGAGAGPATGPASASTSASASQIDATAVSARASSSQSSSGLEAATDARIVGGPAGQAIADFDNASGTATAIALSASGASAVDSLNAEDGAFGGVSVGYVLAQRMFGLFDRIEAYGAFSNNDDEGASSGVSFSAVSSDGRAAIALFDTNGIASPSSFEEKQREIGLRFKSDNGLDSGFPIIVSLEPFYRKEDLKADASVGADFAQRSSANAHMYGAQLAVETEVPLMPGALSFVGRVSGGVYAVNMDGSSSERVGSYSLAFDGDDDETGFRLGAEAGLRLQVNELSFVTLTGAVDHFSEAPTAGGTNIAQGFVLDDQTDYQAKLNMTFRTN